jgi:phosphatidylglycerophosphate synthase
MFKNLNRARLPLRLLAGIFGILLLTYLVHRAGPAKLLESMATLGWGLGLVIAWGGVSHVLKTWAWRLTLLEEKHRVSFARMLGLRLTSEAVGQLGGLGQLFGEGLRVSLLGSAMPLASGITSVTLDRSFFVLSAAVVSIVGLLAVLIVLPLPHALALYASLFALTLLGFILLTAVGVRKRWPVLSGTAQVLGGIRYFSGWIEPKRSLIHSVESKLFDFYHRTPGSFWGSFALNLVCHTAAVFEVYLILCLMGARVSIFGALAIEALTKLVNIAGTFNPGNIGTYEGGNMLIVKMFGLSGAAGLTLAFARRLRAIFWAAVGGLCLVMLSKSRKQTNSYDRTDEAIPVGQEPISPPKLQKMSGSSGSSHVAVILANNIQGVSFGATLPQVGALPVLLRAVLGAQKAGATRIVVVIDQLTGSWIQRELLRTRRLPAILEWFEVAAGEISVPALLGQIAGQTDQNLVLIAGDRTYHPSLHRRAGEWDGEGSALAMTTGTQLVGIYVLSPDAIEVAIRCTSAPSTLEELHSCLTSTHSVQGEPVPEDKWQLMLTREQRLAAEQKLDQWLVKPTDGIFARMNRRVSIPISRQLIQFPITPNMVSLFTLGVSFAAGACFALGGYWNVLLGAALSVFASILDGCDGEVARLKLQESDFGCWLETICDYLYYLFIFTGMTIGLVRSSGNRTYLVWGSLLVFGAVASFLTTGLQRHQLATGRPEQYLRNWHAKADSRRSNPLLYVGRHTEFIIRRCFLPYAFLFFALFNVVNWALVAAAIGANVVWIIALYSYRAFASARASIVSPAA